MSQALHSKILLGCFAEPKNWQIIKKIGNIITNVLYTIKPCYLPYATFFRDFKVILLSYLGK